MKSKEILKPSKFLWIVIQDMRAEVCIFPINQNIEYQELKNFEKVYISNVFQPSSYSQKIRLNIHLVKSFLFEKKFNRYVVMSLCRTLMNPACLVNYNNDGQRLIFIYNIC
ncbi:hypothetical protein BpHYR1_039511 [Brachionus plicatilis]|uniref:Uncharacterized protein n=1 Tax=Brachionus plicatilis TaxID=10195 RepID=A0A3M7R3J1_BRAPC|nr:hypothetical protein BpHYR1_039511 [Brachionus plicatilis]